MFHSSVTHLLALRFRPEDKGGRRPGRKGADVSTLHGHHDHEKARPFKQGETLFREGDFGHTMFVVLEGQVDIMVGDKVVDRVLPGGFFGEMAILDAQPRAATAVGSSWGRLLEIDEAEFEGLVAHTPSFAIKVMRMLVLRLRRSQSAPGNQSSPP